MCVLLNSMPKANEDLEGIWYYSYHHFGEPQADRYVEHLSRRSPDSE
ncbi:type II toxin-antitoxin system RelE/ParE family toxin [Escherichia fergusonii]|nr:type II toxin-antitoxin system RelE/ParE family toxin [Escherichia fergusonii]